MDVGLLDNGAVMVTRTGNRNDNLKLITGANPIWLVQLDPTQGFEIKKTRPCLIISPNEMSSLKTAIVVPMASKGFAYPARIEITFEEKKGLVLLDQMRTVD